MENWLKQNWFRVASPLIILVLITLLISDRTPEKEPVGKVVERAHIGTPLSATGDVTCTYPQMLTVNFQPGTITQEISKPETNPMIFTFSGIDEDTSKLKYIDATRTISEVPIIKIYEDTERLVFVEGGNGAYVTTHTVFRESSISIFSKQTSLLGIPIGTMAMGTCVDS